MGGMYMDTDINILIVEDDSLISEMYLEALILEGFDARSIMVSRKVPEAKIAYENNKATIEIIFFDGTLCGVSSEELIREIRVHSQVPMLCISGDKTDKLVAAAGSNCIGIEKPAEFKQILKAVSDLGISPH